MSQTTMDEGQSEVLRVLTLDGGGAKGFYTLGVLKEIEAMIGCPLYQKFDLVFGTSTGAIIASLIALGHNVDSILDLYRKHVPTVMSQKTAPARSAALKKLARAVFGDAAFNDVKTGIGIVTAKWLTELPMIFKGRVAQAHGRVGTFVGSSSFGVDLMYTGIKSTPNDGRRHEQSGYHYLRARAAGTMGNRQPGVGYGNDTP